MKTVIIQETGRHARLGQDRRLPDVVTHSRPQRAPARSRMAIQVNLTDPAVGIAIDWVTGQSCSFANKAERRLDVQSSLRKFLGKSASAT